MSLKNRGIIWISTIVVLVLFCGIKALFDWVFTPSNLTPIPVSVPVYMNNLSEKIENLNFEGGIVHPQLDSEQLSIPENGVLITDSYETQLSIASQEGVISKKIAFSPICAFFNDSSLVENKSTILSKSNCKECVHFDLDLKELLTAFVDNKTWEDVGFKADGNIKIAIPEKEEFKQSVIFALHSGLSNNGNVTSDEVSTNKDLIDKVIAKAGIYTSENFDSLKNSSTIYFGALNMLESVDMRIWSKAYFKNTYNQELIMFYKNRVFDDFADYLKNSNTIDKTQFKSKWNNGILNSATPVQISNEIKNSLLVK